MKDKIVSAADAIATIRNGDTVGVSGFVGAGTPDELIVALEKRFLEQQGPTGLTLVFAAAPGDGKERGLNRLAHTGLIKRAIGGHWSLVPKLCDLALNNSIEAYNLPLGCISQLFREIAGHRPGLTTQVGLRTFVDPRQDGGRINSATTEEIVELVEMDGKEWLFYKAFPIQIAFVRGTTADLAGNITLEREALTLDTLAMAMAARNSRGLVIAQVERLAEEGSLNPRAVQIPGILVDCVVVARPENHVQTYATTNSAALSGQLRVPLDRIESCPGRAQDRRAPRRVRAALGRRRQSRDRHARRRGSGRCRGEGAQVRHPDGRARDDRRHAAEGARFRSSLNPEALIQQNQQFDFYDGGGLDLAVLGMAQTDIEGNVNVSRFGRRLAGAGGFINISQNSRKLVFTGTFTAGGLKTEVKDGKLRILQEGKSRKFIKRVEQITFSGSYASEVGQPVFYVTERCVFRRTAEGVELIEVAPGIDIERDILAHMDFHPIIKTPQPDGPANFRGDSWGWSTRCSG